MAGIADIKARKILDSRGEWTIEATIFLEGGIFASASVPQGKSRGSFEALYVEPDIAVLNMQEKLLPKLKGMSAHEQEKIDTAMREIDGTSSKSRIGANAMLGVSLAAARAAAKEKDVLLSRHIRGLYKGERKEQAPKLYMNMINGGLHAGNVLSIQEYMVIPQTETVGEAVAIGQRMYHALREHLGETIGKNAVNIGDEGGFAPPISDNMKPFALFAEAAHAIGVADKIRYGIDAAATNAGLSKDEPLSLYRAMKAEYGIAYIEDPFAEDDFESFAELAEEMGENTIICGDDLTVTNLPRMEKAHGKESVNGIIIKPNQIGTLTEALAAIQKAREYGWSVIVSHRSGETNDTAIADIACAVGADGIKLGAPARGERIAKYNRLLQLEAGTKQDL